MNELRTEFKMTLTHMTDEPEATGEWTMPQAQPSGNCLACWQVLERFQWASGLALTSYGVSLGVRVNDAALLRPVLDRLPPGWAAAASPDVDTLYSVTKIAGRSRVNPAPFYYVYRGGCQLGRSRDWDALLPILESDLHLSVATQADKHVFVHAGVVAYQGQAIVMPGRSFAGKTTLAAALVRAGAEYLSDEYAVIDPQGQVHPYAKALSVRAGADLAEGRYSAEALGGHAASGPLPVGMIVSARYEAGARWRPSAMTSGQALLELLENAVRVREMPRLAMQTLPKAVREVQSYRGKRGEADRVAAWLLERIQTQTENRPKNQTRHQDPVR